MTAHRGDGRRWRKASRAKLTSREWQVLDLLRQDLATSEIARRLVLSLLPVRTHTNFILERLGVPDRQALLRRLHPER